MDQSLILCNVCTQVMVKDRSTGSLIDSYRLRIGIRELKWDAKGVYINSKPIYFKGFGRHEDSIVKFLF